MGGWVLQTTAGKTIVYGGCSATPHPPPSGRARLPTGFAAVHQEGALLAHESLHKPCPLRGHLAGI